VPRSNRPRRPKDSGRRGRGRGSSGSGSDSGGSGGGGPAFDPERALFGTARREQRRDGEWLVRPLSGAAASKTYRCPGCHQEIPPGTPHLVAWPAEEPIGAFGGIHDRRHWHTGCWKRH